MISRSRWRCVPGLAEHLQRTDTNEQVILRDDLTRGLPADLDGALCLCAAIARTNPRTTRDVIHIKISPGRPMPADGIERMLARIEFEHGIPDTVPRFVVQHTKGQRPDHFHVVYAIVDPASGRAIPSDGNYLRDELISRLTEIAFGEPIVPGPRQGLVAAELRTRGLEHEANLIGGHDPPARGCRLGDDSRQHASGLGVNAVDMAVAAYQMWQDAEADRGRFALACRTEGYRLAHGDRAVLLVHDATGVHLPLARALRQQAKAAGAPLNIRERDLRDGFGDIPTLDKARDAGLAAESKKARASVDRELERLQQEALIDGQRALADRLRRVRETERLDRKRKRTATLKARREAIRAEYGRRDRIRRARVARSFAAARLLGRPDLRRLVFQVAAAGVMLAGGGLGLALVTAGIAVAVLPSRERARATAYAEKLHRGAERDEVAAALKKAYADVFSPPAPRIDFASIGRGKRAIAGAYCHLILDEIDGRKTARHAADKDRLALALGDLAPRLEEVIRTGGERQALTILGWYGPADARKRGAVDAGRRRAKAQQPGRKPKEDDLGR